MEINNSKETDIRKLKMINRHLVNIIGECFKCDNRLKNSNKGDELEFIPSKIVECCGLVSMLGRTINDFAEKVEELKSQNDEEQDIYNSGVFFGVVELTWRILDNFRYNRAFCCSYDKIHEKCPCLKMFSELNAKREIAEKESERRDNEDDE